MNLTKNKCFAFIGILVGGLFYFSAFGQSSSLSLPNSKEKIKIEDLTKVPADKNFHIELKMREHEYLAEPPNSDQPNQIYSFSGRMNYYQRTYSQWVFVSDIKVISAERESEKPYLNIPDFYTGYDNQTSLIQFYLGRKREEWSAFDDLWKLGVWQPIARWDYIHPETLGLTGAFLNVGNEWMRVKLFGTPFFLPDQGPNFELKDGRFSSNNRWFWTPQNQTTILSQPSHLYYDLDRPSEQDVIMHDGFAGALEVGHPHSGGWGRFSYSRKPRNQLHLGIEGKLQISKDNRTQVTVHPIVVYHNVATVEAGYKTEDLSFWGSVTNDRPEESGQPEDWVQSELREINIFSGMLQHSLRWIGLRNSHIRYSYMQIDKRKNLAPSTLLGDTVDSSLDRFMFDKVFSTEYMQQFFISNHYSLRYGIKYLYSIPDEAGLFSTKIEYLVGENFIFDLGLDVLGANESADKAGSGLMTRYRSNDRVAVGMTYVF
ncbi:MAG: hypothetical protein KDD34_01005 [Bdellovibrionales bacterium]|nr:hypothetical protein [Bdellovibrionales bacterium]